MTWFQCGSRGWRGSAAFLVGMVIGVVTAALCSARKMADNYWDDLDEKKGLDGPDEIR